MIKVKCLILVLTAMEVIFANGVYFPMSGVEVNLPIRNEDPHLSVRTIASLRALPSRKGRKPHLKYALEDSAALQISPGSGNLTFAPGTTAAQIKDATLSTKVTVVDSFGNSNETTLTVHASIEDNLDCDLFLSDLCYWQSVTYRILENRDSSVIGTLSSPYFIQICPNFKLSYALINRSEKRVELVPPNSNQNSNYYWIIKTKRHLDREIRKVVKEPSFSVENITVPVICTVIDPSQSTRIYKKTLHIRVLDEDDNLPVPQDKGSVKAVLDRNFVNKDQEVELKHHGTLDKTLILTDQDSLDVNHYEFTILNDTLGALTHKCNMYEDDREIEAQTVIHCRLIFTRTLELPQPYLVTLQINDTSYVGKETSSLVKIPIIIFGNESENPEALGLTLPPNAYKPLILYPDRNVSVFRSSAPLSRITQPRAGAKKKEMSNLEILDAQRGAFNITPAEGIVYVQNISALRELPSSVRLTIRWYDKSKNDYENDEIVVNIIEEPSETCSKRSDNIKDWNQCSEFTNPKRCENACAVATGGAVSVRNRGAGGAKTCMWRGEKTPGKLPTTLYSTCTPDNSTCPDGVCDNYELLDYRICPQDCSKYITFPTEKNQLTGRGISVGEGICSCDSTGQCSCLSHDPKSDSGSYNSYSSKSAQVSGICLCDDARINCTCYKHGLNGIKKERLFQARLNGDQLKNMQLIDGNCTCAGNNVCECLLSNTSDDGSNATARIDNLSLIDGECECRNMNTKCFCGFHKNVASKELKNEVLHATMTSNISRHTGTQIASCGKGCVLGILAGCLFLVGALAATIACWRFERVNKVREKVGTDNDLSAPLSEYLDRSAVPFRTENTITLNFDMSTSLIQQRSKYEPDPKWEFPRSRLFIEQALGEGEFGRVLRARAKDIATKTGFTIVAVKTLKDDARESELLDLLSEYELLKGVSHPNIIKLLGACTMPGGPAYLIIEYAELGSLRNYLRRSRHKKSEGAFPLSSSLDSTETASSNYDEPKPCKITQHDILSFAWQISKGMTYLSDVKLVHRDLAARNVLLTSEMVCKISDFGLTRDIYEEDAYFKRSKGRVPVKWMAPESLSDHVYTSKSDVWSFGILIWELVTLGATPYPGIQVQNLFHLLQNGYRMEKPTNCSGHLYKIMRGCWHMDPEQRPSFHELSLKWEKMLGDQVEYLDLVPNAIHNRSYFCTNENNEVMNERGEFSLTSQSLEEYDEDDDNSDSEESEDENVSENLAASKELLKCGDTEKNLEELKPSNVSNASLSPVARGYVTPVKRVSHDDGAAAGGGENQYYTNMDPSTKCVEQNVN